MMIKDVQLTISDQIGYVFSEFFGIIYPYVHNHFVSYSLILIAAGAGAWKCYHQFKRSKPIGSKVFWGLIGVVLGAFCAWLIFIHFQTFMSADLYFEQ